MDVLKMNNIQNNRHGDHSIRSTLLALLGLLAALGLMALSSQARAQVPVEPTVQAEAPVPTGNEACKTCHETNEQHRLNIYHSDCLVCHTPTTEHLEEGGRGNIKLPDSNTCLACHQYNDHKRMNWAFSEHSKAGVECRQCHGNHAPKVKELPPQLMKTDKDSALCMSCHQDVAARLTLTSHHPVREGALSCVNCHAPHDARQTSLFSKNERCTQCHQNVRGPKVFEHPPVVEDCLICHNPHGSPNRRLLQLAQPMQCVQCHSLAITMHGGMNLNGAQMRNCVNCHSAIHGSHSDPELKY